MNSQKKRMLIAKMNVSANLADWSDHLLSVQINDFSGMNPGTTTYNDKLTRSKEKSIFFHLLLFSEKLYTDITNETNPYY